MNYNSLVDIVWILRLWKFKDGWWQWQWQCFANKQKLQITTTYKEFRSKFLNYGSSSFQSLHSSRCLLLVWRATLPHSHSATLRRPPAVYHKNCAFCSNTFHISLPLWLNTLWLIYFTKLFTKGYSYMLNLLCLGNFIITQFDDLHRYYIIYYNIMYD